MNHNEMVGVILGAIMTIAGFFFFFYDRLAKKNKEDNDYREKQLQATLETNFELRRLNDKLELTTKSQDKRLDDHNEKIVDLDKRVTTIEGIKFVKDRS